MQFSSDDSLQSFSYCSLPSTSVAAFFSKISKVSVNFLKADVSCVVKGYISDVNADDKFGFSIL